MAEMEDAHGIINFHYVLASYARRHDGAILPIAFGKDQPYDKPDVPTLLISGLRAHAAAPIPLSIISGKPYRISL